MVKIRKQLCPADRYYLKCPYSRTPSRIVVHNTANDAPAVNEITYMVNNDNEVSYHYAVDDREAVQGLPLDRNAWASGDGHGKGNMEGIHIEICYSLSGGERFEKAEKNAAQLIARLLKQYGWGIDRVTKHQDYDGKYCPHRTLDLGWQRFLDMVKQEMEEETVTYEQWKEYQQRYEKEQAAKQVSKWAEPAMAYCKENHIMSGDGAGNFRPQSNVTRQELAQVMLNLWESPQQRL
ncbi:N-acetylmuramoyl-L-alanine amidase [uncultured Neglectibacter sp.]|uniref:N-acetylmuramoyl-L-alanine amidase n=1 Tax=uncultured Neglectibacter sp. TaxID=1924108 RepID=UPI0034DEDF7C